MSQPQILDGKKVSETLKSELADEVKALVAKGHRPPHLLAILVGSNPASMAYVSSKVKACEEYGFRSTLLDYKEDITEEFLLSKLRGLNEDPEVDGILVQLPLPPHISAIKVIETISPVKDVDGFHPINIGRMAKNLPAPLPATPAGIIELLRRHGIKPEGMNAVVIGNSNIVGSPMSILLAREWDMGNATVTVCHRQTRDLAFHTRQADLIVIATGVVNLLRGDMVKEGAIVVDVGINRVEDATAKKGYRIVGDVDYDAVAPKCSWITPVPGGVGPMTIAMVLANTVQLYKAGPAFR